MYKFDVFISYRRHDLGREWIGKYFVPELRRYLQLEIDRDPIIFWDDFSILGGEIPRAKVLEGIKYSKCIIPVLSKFYFNSPWCSAEWQTFWDRSSKVGGKSLTVPIKWHDSEDYEQGFGALAPKAGLFGDYRLTADAWKSSETYVRFQRDVEKLAQSVAAILDEPPAFDEQWPWSDPDKIAPIKNDAGEWVYQLKPSTGTAT